MTTGSAILAAAAMLLCGVQSLFANPEPDVPVRCDFTKDGTCTITVEVDPRCFVPDPMSEKLFMKMDVDLRSAENLQEIQAQARDALSQWIRFEFDAPGELSPVFTLAFTGPKGVPVKKAGDPVIVTATWKFQIPAAMKRLRVHATKQARFSVVVSGARDGAASERFATLFPGESSFWLEVP